MIRLQHLILACAAATATLVAMAPRAHAGTAVVIVHGKAPVPALKATEDAVRATARDANWTVIDSPFSREEQDTIIACFINQYPWPCVATLMTTKRVERLIVVEVVDDNERLSITERILLGGHALAPSIDARHCEQCQEIQISDSATELTKTLLDRALATQRPVPGLLIRTEPAGATVLVDGRGVEAAGPIATTAGTHVVTVHLEGYESVTREVVVGPGLPESLTIKLKPRGANGPSYLPAIVVGSVGAAALGFGIGLQATKDPSPDGAQNSTLYSTPGIALMIGGGAAVVVAGVLAIRTRSARKRQSAPTAFVTPDSAFVGWAGSF